MTAPLVYANYGQQKDFQWLDAHNVSVKGRIVLVRYGEVFRGLKVCRAKPPELSNQRRMNGRARAFSRSRLLCL